MKHEDTTTQIIGILNESTATLDAQITARLAHARQQAVAALDKRARRGQPPRQSAIARLLDQLLQHHRTAVSAALVCSAVFVAFLVTQQFSDQELMGQGDAFLLASELPPEAYLDKGFDVWLERTSKQ